MSRPAEQMRAKGAQPATTEEATQATIDAGDTIADTPHDITLADGVTTVEIRRCKVLQLSSVLRLVRDFFADLKVEKAGDLPKIDLQNPTVILRLFSDYSDQVFAVAASLTSLSEEEMVSLDMDDALLVVKEVWTLNQNFFLQKILPMAGGLLQVGGATQDPEDNDSLSPESGSTKTSSTISSSSSGTGSRRKRSKTSR